MSFEAMGWAINEDTGNPQSKLILLILASMADEHGKCWPSHNYIAEKACLGRRSVITHLKALESTYRVSVQHRNNEKGKTSNMYTVCFRPHILKQERDRLVQNMHMGSAGDAHAPCAGDAHKTVTLIKQSDKHNVQTEFERWWACYPKKVGKKPALTIWKRIKPNVDTLIADTTTRALSDSQWLSGYIPNPTTYLNQERWNDEISRKAGNGTGKQSISPAAANRAAAAEHFSRGRKNHGDIVAENDGRVSTLVG